MKSRTARAEAAIAAINDVVEGAWKDSYVFTYAAAAIQAVDAGETVSQAMDRTGDDAGKDCPICCAAMAFAMGAVE
jgi:hypothetical protein